MKIFILFWYSYMIFYYHEHCFCPVTCNATQQVSPDSMDTWAGVFADVIMLFNVLYICDIVNVVPYICYACICLHSIYCLFKANYTILLIDINSLLGQDHIRKTSPCNIQQYFTPIKIIIFR